MGQPANLKKQTRQRMERTGESYTTARKNILTDKPEGPRAARAAAARNYAKEAREKAKAQEQSARTLRLLRQLTNCLSTQRQKMSSSTMLRSGTEF